jgi:NIPSNAP
VAVVVGGSPGQLVEFRNYRILPEGVGEFVEHFEAHFLASQEAVGMDIVGQFRVAGDAGRFVWVRRYLEPASRAESLRRFYTGPVWKEFGPRANELMVDHTDVDLLVPDASGPAFAAGHVPHAERAGDPVPTASTVVAARFELDPATGIAPAMAAAMAAAVDGAPEVAELGRLVSAGIPNDFPALPVHEDVMVALWLLSAADGGIADALARAVGDGSGRPVTTLHLVPTPRSTLR